MISPRAKQTAALLLGFLLAWTGALNVRAGAGTSVGVSKSSCCCPGCDSKHCSTPVCCAKPANDSTPNAPAIPRGNSQNEFQALAVAGVALLTLPSVLMDEAQAAVSSRVRFAAIPIFQRDCAYLI